MKTQGISIVAVLLALIAGCQCCPCTDNVGNLVDSVNDTHVYFDHWYNPRFDLTRMGKPDWCSPFNQKFCRRNCVNGCYDRFDECHLYPPITPYEFPSNIMPPPVYRTKRIERPEETEMREMDFDSPDVNLPSDDPKTYSGKQEL